MTSTTPTTTNWQGVIQLSIFCVMVACVLFAPDVFAQSKIGTAGQSMVSEVLSWGGWIFTLGFAVCGFCWGFNNFLQLSNPAKATLSCIAGAAVCFGAPALVGYIRSLVG